jgi:malonate decarboxylase beta subunit
MTQFPSALLSFQELTPRERVAALFDGGRYVELLDPFDGITSPWLSLQGVVSQADDGVVVVRGEVEGHEVVGIAIEPRHEGGSIGEAGGAKIAHALRLAARSSSTGRPIAAVLLLETGGVRLQEATLGLAAIGDIHAAITDLRKFAPVIAVLAGPIGCFGGMSLAAALCTKIIATPHGRLGMNGAEVIEQEAGPQELDASDRELTANLFGSRDRLRDGYIDVLVEDRAEELCSALHDALRTKSYNPARLQNPLAELTSLRHELNARGATSFHSRTSQEEVSPDHGRGWRWLKGLGAGEVSSLLSTRSLFSAEIPLGPNPADRAIAFAIGRDAASMLPRASNGEMGLEQAWALAESVRSFVVQEKGSEIKRPIIAIVDSPGQAFGRTEEELCISIACAAAIDAYREAQRHGHLVLTLIVGKAMSGSYLAHGMQSDHVSAVVGEGTAMHAMSPDSISRVTKRTLAEVEENMATVLPMSSAIQDAHRLGLIDTLLANIQGEAPTEADFTCVKKHLSDVLITLRHKGSKSRDYTDNPDRHATAKVYDAMLSEWTAFDRLSRDN